MYSNISDMQVFGRLVDGKIAEYPVYGIHIKNRAHPIEWYVSCTFDEMPIIPAFYNLYETATVEAVTTPEGTFLFNRIHVSYSVKAQTLQEVLSGIHKPAAGSLEPAPGQAVTPVAVADVAPEAIDQVVLLTKEFVQNLLDAFAATRGYSNVVSAASYSSSTVVSFANDAARVILVRDNTWSALYAYLDLVMAGTEPVPKSVGDIDLQLPALTWV